jgi:uncharacterized phage-associated protein
MAARRFFTVNQDKVLETLVFIASERPGIDVFHVCKVLYFAEKAHLNQYGRPISGDTYFALPRGPVPTLAYDMVKGDPKVGGAMLEKVGAALASDKASEDDYTRIRARRQPNLDLFSESDLECLKAAIARYADMDPQKLLKLAHEESGYLSVYREGARVQPISYDLILNKDNPYYAEVLRDLEENAGLVLL